MDDKLIRDILKNASKEQIHWFIAQLEAKESTDQLVRILKKL